MAVDIRSSMKNWYLLLTIFVSANISNAQTEWCGWNKWCISMYPSWDSTTSVQISFSDGADSGEENFYLFFSAKGMACRNPSISLEYEAIDYASAGILAEYLDVYDNDNTKLAHCKPYHRTAVNGIGYLGRCNVFVTCIDNLPLSVGRIETNHTYQIRVYQSTQTTVYCNQLKTNAKLTMFCGPTPAPTLAPTHAPTHSPTAAVTLVATVESGKKGISVGVIFAVVFVVIILVIITFYYQRRRIKSLKENNEIIEANPKMNCDNIVPSAPDVELTEEVTPIDVSNCDEVETTQKKFAIGESDGLIEGIEGNVAHFDICEWFKYDVALNEYNSTYIDLFVVNGFDNVKALIQMTDEDMKSIGINKLGHRKVMLSAIKNMQSFQGGKVSSEGKLV